MKYYTLFILFFIQSIEHVSSQNVDSLKNSWYRITIQDTYVGWSNFNNLYLIQRSNYHLTLLDMPEFEIKTIDSSLIHELFSFFDTEKLINNNSLYSKEGSFYQDPLIMFGKDSLWLIKNAERLWYEYLKERDESPVIDSLAIRIIKNYSQIKDLIRYLHGKSWTDDYPLFHIEIITKSDTFFIQSYGQFPYMLPWRFNGLPTYNSRVSEIIAQILPNKQASNKSRITGEKFNYYLIDYIYRYYIEDQARKIKSYKKYPMHFQKLEKHFQIASAEMTDMASIEWGRDLGRNCLELSLKDSTISKNISFYVVLGRRIKLHSTLPLIHHKAKLIKQLSDNPVFRYTITHANCEGEIHFVNKKSLSGVAKRAFKSDIRENKIAMKPFRGKFQNAIFYELSERRENESSFSRWIFLKNGTIMLWQIKGDYLMNLPEHLIEENGYVCKVISKDDFSYLDK